MVGNAASAWAQHNGNVEAFAAAAPTNAAMLHRIRYEALLSDFDDVAAGLFAFLNVDHTPAVVAAVREATGFEQLSGRKQGEEDPASFFRKGIAGDWEGRLDPKALDIIERYCGSLMHASAYTKISL
jgi:hypothetical protein